MMLGVSLELKPADFKRIFVSPRAPVIGLVAQFLLLPAFTFLLTLAILLAVPAPDSLPNAPLAEEADLVLVGGRVLTMLEPEPEPRPRRLAWARLLKRTLGVDGLERFESRLSEGLPADTKAARAEALRRVQQLDDTRMAPAKNAAIGLAKAVQYGVDRYPAIVFDGRAVIYGVTDLVEALDRYDAWQREQAR